MAVASMKASSLGLGGVRPYRRQPFAEEAFVSTERGVTLFRDERSGSPWPARRAFLAEPPHSDMAMAATGPAHDWPLNTSSSSTSGAGVGAGTGSAGGNATAGPWRLLGASSPGHAAAVAAPSATMPTVAPVGLGASSAPMSAAAEAAGEWLEPGPVGGGGSAVAVSQSTAATRQQLDALEHRFAAAVAALHRQQVADQEATVRLAEQAVGRLEARLAVAETQQLRVERRAAELAGVVKGVGDEQQACTRRIERLQERVRNLQATCGQEEADIRRRVSELEQEQNALSTSAQASAAAEEEAQRRCAQRLRQLELQFEELRNAEGSWRHARALEARVEALEVRRFGTAPPVGASPSLSLSMSLMQRDADQAGLGALEGNVWGADTAAVTSASVGAGGSPAFAAAMRELRVLSERCDSLQDVVEEQVLASLRQVERKFSDHDMKVDQLLSDGQECAARIEEQEVRLGVVRSKMDALDQRLVLVSDRADRDVRVDRLLPDRRPPSTSSPAPSDRDVGANHAAALECAHAVGSTVGGAASGGSVTSAHCSDDLLPRVADCERAVEAMRTEFAERSGKLAMHAQAGFADVRAHLGAVAEQLRHFRDRDTLSTSSNATTSANTCVGDGEKNGKDVACLAGRGGDAAACEEEVRERLSSLEVRAREQEALAEALRRSFPVIQTSLSEVKHALEAALSEREALEREPSPQRQPQDPASCCVEHNEVAEEAALSNVGESSAVTNVGEEAVAATTAVAAMQRRLDEVVRRVGSLPSRMSVLEEHIEWLVVANERSAATTNESAKETRAEKATEELCMAQEARVEQALEELRKSQERLSQRVDSDLAELQAAVLRQRGEQQETGDQNASPPSALPKVDATSLLAAAARVEEHRRCAEAAAAAAATSASAAASAGTAHCESQQQKLQALQAVTENVAEQHAVIMQRLTSFTHELDGVRRDLMVKVETAEQQLQNRIGALAQEHEEYLEKVESCEKGLEEVMKASQKSMESVERHLEDLRKAPKPRTSDTPAATEDCLMPRLETAERGLQEMQQTLRLQERTAEHAMLGTRLEKLERTLEDMQRHTLSVQEQCAGRQAVGPRMEKAERALDDVQQQTLRIQEHLAEHVPSVSRLEKAERALDDVQQQTLRLHEQLGERVPCTSRLAKAERALDDAQQQTLRLHEQLAERVPSGPRLEKSERQLEELQQAMLRQERLDMPSKMARVEQAIDDLNEAMAGQQTELVDMKHVVEGLRSTGDRRLPAASSLVFRGVPNDVHHHMVDAGSEGGQASERDAEAAGGHGSMPVHGVGTASGRGDGAVGTTQGRGDGAEAGGGGPPLSVMPPAFQPNSHQQGEVAEAGDDSGGPSHSAPATPAAPMPRSAVVTVGIGGQGGASAGEEAAGAGPALSTRPRSRMPRRNDTGGGSSGGVAVVTAEADSGGGNIETPPAEGLAGGSSAHAVASRSHGFAGGGPESSAGMPRRGDAEDGGGPQLARGLSSASTRAAMLAVVESIGGEGEEAGGGVAPVQGFREGDGAAGGEGEEAGGGVAPAQGFREGDGAAGGGLRTAAVVQPPPARNGVFGTGDDADNGGGGGLAASTSSNGAAGANGFHVDAWNNAVDRHARSRDLDGMGGDGDGGGGHQDYGGAAGLTGSGSGGISANGFNDALGTTAVDRHPRGRDLDGMEGDGDGGGGHQAFAASASTSAAGGGTTWDAVLSRIAAPTASSLFGASFEGERISEEAVHDVPDPVWNNESEITDVTADDSLTFMVEDSGSKKDDGMGKATTTSAACVSPGSSAGEFELMDGHGLQSRSSSLGAVGSGCAATPFVRGSAASGAVATSPTASPKCGSGAGDEGGGVSVDSAAECAAEQAHGSGVRPDDSEATGAVAHQVPVLHEESGSRSRSPSDGFMDLTDLHSEGDEKESRDQQSPTPAGRTVASRTMEPRQTADGVFSNLGNEQNAPSDEKAGDIPMVEQRQADVGAESAGGGAESDGYIEAFEEPSGSTESSGASNAGDGSPSRGASQRDTADMSRSSFAASALFQQLCVGPRDRGPASGASDAANGVLSSLGMQQVAPAFDGPASARRASDTGTEAAGPATPRRAVLSHSVSRDDEEEEDTAGADDVLANLGIATSDEETSVEDEQWPRSIGAAPHHNAGSAGSVSMPRDLGSLVDAVVSQGRALHPGRPANAHADDVSDLESIDAISIPDTADHPMGGAGADDAGAGVIPSATSHQLDSRASGGIEVQRVEVSDDSDADSTW